ncbi:MAG: class I SAM-dependent methyltransferase [Calditrichaeota bacterium]|nr:MAG: class I SAM-dependent methyltransferase [Calditrichota bacterium]
MSGKTKDWWETFFHEFRPFFQKISPKETNAQVRFYLKHLNLKKGMSFLDCPVGIGRIAIPLAKRGINVTGIDLAESYLIELEEKASKRNLPLKLFHSDMRRINFNGEFDTAGNLWTSLGYFEKESDNLLVLKKIYTALKPNGKFVIQVINRDWVLNNFSSSDWTAFGKVKVLEQRIFDYAESKSRATWTFIKEGKETAVDTSIRMYSYHELKKLLEKVGFKNVHGFGSLNDDPISRDTREMFIFGEK